MSAMMNDRDLLEAYVRDRSDEAFRELVRRHTALVFSCARQQLGDTHAAEDVTQSVFLALAIKAPKLPPATVLAGWLYRATRFAAADYRRREQHRREREMKAHEQHQIHESANDPAVIWQEIQPHLHAALDALSAADRDALLLRFYQQSSYRDMAQTLAVTEEAAKKRVGRAVERLRRIFGRKGIRLTAGGLVTALGTRSVEAIPATLAAQAAQTALSSLAGTMATTSTLMLAKGALLTMSLSKLKIAAAAAVVFLLAGGAGLYVWQTNPGPAAIANNGPSPAVATTSSQSPRPTVTPSATPRQTNTTMVPAATVPPPVRPRGQDKYADPKQACATLLSAFQQRDPAALAESIAAPTAERKATFCRILPVMYAMGDLEQACRTKFGETFVDKQVIYLQGESLARWLALVPQALLSMDGDAAKLDFTGIVASGALERLPLGTVLEFRQVDGAWKLWITHEPNRKEVQLAEHAERLVPVLQALTTDVQQGRFATAEEVRRTMEEAAQTVMTNAAPATRNAP
jgi:RNA polymerase sigma factor (sigma-70 family)